jgi:hypothetical protein
MYMCTKCKCRVVCRMVWRPCRSPRLSLRPEGRWEAHALSCAVRMVPFLRREKLPWQPGQASGANSRPQLRGAPSQDRPGLGQGPRDPPNKIFSTAMSFRVPSKPLRSRGMSPLSTDRDVVVGLARAPVVCSLSASQRRFGRVTNYVLTWLHRALGMPC